MAKEPNQSIWDKIKKFIFPDKIDVKILELKVRIDDYGLENNVFSIVEIEGNKYEIYQLINFDQPYIEDRVEFAKELIKNRVGMFELTPFNQKSE